MKTFTVTVHGKERTIEGPDDATQAEAQAEADRQFGHAKPAHKPPAPKAKKRR